MKILITVLMFFSVLTDTAAELIKWELKKDKDGILVYSGSIVNSNIKAVKATCTLPARLTELAELLLDAGARKQWVYNVITTYLVKQLTPNEQVYYSEMSMPWPMSNRDAVVLMKITQNPVSKVMQAHMSVTEGYVAVSKEKIRIPFLDVRWTVTPTGKGQVHVEYIAQADPGGSVPSWVVNMFSSKGPYESFQALRTLLLTRKYTGESIDFVVD